MSEKHLVLEPFHLSFWRGLKSVGGSRECPSEHWPLGNIEDGQETEFLKTAGCPLRGQGGGVPYVAKDTPRDVGLNITLDNVALQSMMLTPPAL
jgi:hypothetical protein